ncbi:MAG: GDSL-type esterase/lipase family protein [Cyanobacteria bacterium P01_D01_bin.105]
MTATLSRSSATQHRQAYQPAIATHPKKVIAIGDSLVYGYGDNEGGGWVDRLRLSWMSPDTPGPVFYNLGVRGDGVTQVEKRLEAEFSGRGELRHRKPDMLILSVGVNDSAQSGRVGGRSVTSLEAFEQTMDALLSQSRSLCPTLFVGMVPVDESKMPFAGILHFTRAQQVRYRDITHRLCAAQGIPYLDIFENWSRQGDEWVCDRLSSDGLHPNALGYRTLLQSVQSWQPFIQAIQ